ncbi:unnamed protein product [Fraxinus pennsylvanica]|uniref:Uncharacterized protein n=1 Tax=Fraxinus pennsylvanica TaxID=56036 RepID=A0AAD2ADR7_9LAMI|nr:unnamed protein product [Fraxinus pennsylvanica]
MNVELSKSAGNGSIASSSVSSSPKQNLANGGCPVFLDQRYTQWKVKSEKKKCVRCYVIKRKKKLEGNRLLEHALAVEGKWKQWMLEFNGDFSVCPYVSHSRGSSFVCFVQGVWFCIIVEQFRIWIKDQF